MKRLIGLMALGGLGLLAQAPKISKADQVSLYKAYKSEQRAEKHMAKDKKKLDALQDLTVELKAKYKTTCDFVFAQKNQPDTFVFVCPPPKPIEAAKAPEPSK